MMILARAVLAALAAAAATAALAADGLAACAHDPQASGMAERLSGMREQMDRVQWAANRDEQRRLMDLHLKSINEGMYQLRHRDASDGCRLELTNAMLEQMVRHELAAREFEAR
jgi:hypothetical protein